MWHESTFRDLITKYAYHQAAESAKATLKRLHSLLSPISEQV